MGPIWKWSAIAGGLALPLLLGQGPSWAGKITDANYNPCFLVEVKAQRTMAEENRDRRDLYDSKRKELDRQAYNDWYNCEQVEIYGKVLETIDEYEGGCLRSCSSGDKRCEQRVEGVRNRYEALREQHSKKCPDR